MTGYHATTPKKLSRYKLTGCILPPVRFWIFENSAKEWAKKVGRDIILQFETDVAYPLPDHKPRWHAYWTPNSVWSWKIVYTRCERFNKPNQKKKGE